MTPDLIVVTWQNAQYLVPCVQSLEKHRWLHPFNLIVVNNGAVESIPPFVRDVAKVIDTGENLGWAGGLARGLKESTSEIVGFLNDDIFFPRSSADWLRRLMSSFRNPAVGAVGPASNCVLGSQNIFGGIYAAEVEVPYLIGFCLFVRREYLDDTGGIDLELPVADDLDLSIRFAKAGYKLVMRPDTFVYHHGFKTGERVHGGPDTPGGWNSKEMGERTNSALIRKHGFREWWKCVGPVRLSVHKEGFTGDDTEGTVAAAWVKGERVLELGCGGQKTVHRAVGVDLFAKGSITHHGAVSVADVTGDAFGELPEVKGKFDTIIARHLLEHAVDPIGTVMGWKKKLAKGGRIVVAVPDETKVDGIALDPTHLHAFTPDSMTRMMGLLGFECLGTEQSGNGISFVGAYQR